MLHIIIIAIINSKELIIMNKTELVKKVAAENDLTQKAAAAAVDSELEYSHHFRSSKARN